MTDTDSQSEEVRLRILRAMSPARRLTLAVGWSTALRDMTRAGLRQQFSGASETRLSRLFAERWLGPELAAKVYGALDAHG